MLFVTVTVPPLAVSEPVCNGLVAPRATVEKLKPAAGAIASNGTVAKFTPDFAVFEIVTCWLTGLKFKPVFVGVTVYVPFASPLKV